MGNDFDYDENQAKLNPPSDEKEDDAEETEEESTDEFEMDDYDPSEDHDEDSEDEEEPPAEKVEPEVKPTEVKPEPTPTLTPVQAEAIKAEAIKLVGEDAVLTIKGVERKLKDFSPQEIVIGLQKGVRADQIFNELSVDRRKLEEERALVERGAVVIQDYLEKINSGQVANAASHQGPPAELLRITEDDTEETVQLKQVVAAQAQRLGHIEGAFRNTASEAKLKGLVDEVRSFDKDYPMASVDEAIAVKLARPDINTEDLMRAGHNYYSSEAHGRAVMAANPTFKRAYDDEVIKQYLARKQPSKSITGTKSSSSGSKKLSESAKKPIRDFKGADAGAKAYIRELMRTGNTSD
jgi:hypothetical protein